MKQHQVFDRYADQWLSDYQTTGRTVYCREGCSGCCSLVVHATYPEAEMIANALSPDQVRSLDAYLVRLKDAMPHLTDMKSYLRKHRSHVGPCPLLDATGRCLVYPRRPLSCRALLSTRPAEWCTVDYSQLDPWDKMVYEAGLDKQVVAWPTHFVASTRDLGQELENQILDTMHATRGWSLSGNLATMVWLACRVRRSGPDAATADRLRDFLHAEGLDFSWLVDLRTDSGGR